LAAGPIYKLVDIGEMGGVSIEAFSVNASGSVAGRAYDAQGYARGFAYDGAFQVFDRGADLRAINADGAMAGTQNGVATLWRAGASTALGTLGGLQSWGLGTDDLGYMTGGAQVASGATHAYLFADGNIIDLGTLGGSWSSGYAVNGGSVVGAAETANGVTQAFRWTAQSGMTPLSSTGESRAFAVNASGAVAGAAIDGSGHYRAALWSPAGTVQFLGTLGGAAGFAYGINGSGHAVGYSYDAAGRQRAFLWTGSMLFDLNTLFDAPGWQLTAAYGINDNGQIVGTAEFYGRSTAFRLDPLSSSPQRGIATAELPEPAALHFVAIGLLPFIVKKLRATVTRN
jgi:probable HAF family extracellular repeat protein